MTRIWTFTPTISPFSKLDQLTVFLCNMFRLALNTNPQGKYHLELINVQNLLNNFFMTCFCSTNKSSFEISNFCHKSLYQQSFHLNILILISALCAFSVFFAHVRTTCNNEHHSLAFFYNVRLHHQLLLYKHDRYVNSQFG